jgi:hypothetical protein
VLSPASRTRLSGSVTACTNAVSGWSGLRSMRTPVADPPAAISPVRTWTSPTWTSGTKVARRLRKPRDRLGELVRQPLGGIEQVDPARAAEVGSGHRPGPAWRSLRGGRGEPAGRGQGKLGRDRGLTGARLAEQEKHPWRPVEELVKAGDHPAPAGEIRRPLPDVGPVKL